MLRCESSFELSSPSGLAESVLRVLAEWRTYGPDAARQILPLDQLDDPLIKELDLRLSREPGPRLLVDGLWFSRPFGGITRVWDQILRCSSFLTFFMINLRCC